MTDQAQTDYKNTLNLADTAFFGLNIEKKYIKNNGLIKKLC